MKTYTIYVRFELAFLDPDDAVGDGLSWYHGIFHGDIQAKSRHQAWRHVKDAINQRWPVRWTTRYTEFAITENEHSADRSA